MLEDVADAAPRLYELRFAGAAQELDGAMIVNPYDVDDVANALHRALKMSIEERRERHSGMLELVRRRNVHSWRRKFLAELAETRREIGLQAS